MLPINQGGSPELKERFLSRFGGGKLLTAIAAIEPNAGSDPLGMKTLAIREGASYVNNGQKSLVSDC